MKNNLKTFFSIIILFIFFQKNTVFSKEEFNFDISEIEITDNGNKYKGLKRGTLISNNGLIIKSNKFEYDRQNNILNATGEVEIYDQVNNYIIYANDITYLLNVEKIFTRGETKALIESKYDFLSKNVTLLRNEKEFFSSENTVVKDNELNQYDLTEFRFLIEDSLLKGRNINVTSDYNKYPEERDYIYYKDGIFNLKTKNYHASDTKIFLKKNTFGLNKGSIQLSFEEDDAFEISKNDPRLYGASSSKKNGITVVNKATFTSCGLNDNCPPWHINAQKITHDKSKKQLIYDNAFLNVFNVPILYFPKFFHPDPTVKRQSGLLTPQVNNTDILGSSVIIPYFHVISDNKDLTLTPTFFDSDINMLQAEYRQKNKFSDFIADFAHARGYQASSSPNKNSISHLFARYNLDLNLPKFSKSILNINVEKVSNDTYLKIFDTNLIDKQIKPTNQDTLNSSLKLYFNTDVSNLETGISAYENLNGKNSDRFQYILPYYNYNKTLGSNQIGNFNFSSNGYNNLKDTNSMQTLQTNNLNFLSNDFITNMGLVNNFGVYIKNLNTVGKNYSSYKNNLQSEILSIYNLEISYPLIKLEENYTNYFTPKLSARFNTGSMKDYSSSKRSINTDNIFSIDRLSIDGDSFEEGRSLTTGISYTKEDVKDINKYFSYSLATVFRDKEQKKIPYSSSIGGKTSNLVGSAEYSLSDNHIINYDFSLDNNYKNFEYNSISATYYNDNFMTRFNFIEENGKIGQTNSIENITEFKLSNDNYFYFNTRKNRETNLTEYYDLIYEYKNDCLTANVKYKKTYYQDRDLTPDEQIFFSITLFPLSTFEQKISPNLYRD